MTEQEKAAYRVEHRDGAWWVVRGDEQAVCSCRDEANAQQYVALLNEAYRRGYRHGYRTAKRGPT